MANLGTRIKKALKNPGTKLLGSGATNLATGIAAGAMKMPSAAILGNAAVVPALAGVLAIKNAQKTTDAEISSNAANRPQANTGIVKDLDAAKRERLMKRLYNAGLTK